MTIATFIAKNALRNKRRAALSILSVAVSLFLLTTLLVLVREFTIPPEDIGAASRIVVRNKISLANFLPARQRAVLEKIPGVEAVTPFSFYGGKFRSEDFPKFAQFAIDAKFLAPLMAEAKIDPEQLENFIKDQTSCIVGRITAKKYEMKIGDKLPFTGTIWPCNLELKVAGFYEGTIDDRNVFFHHKYLDEANGNTGVVGTWWLRAANLDDMSGVLDRINKAFANTSAEVRAETERAFQMSMVSMWGNIKILIGSICSVVVFTLMLVSASTMSMAIRERFRELAVLKALGFQRRELFAFILAESFGLAATGALLGVGGAWLVFTHGLVAGYVCGGVAVMLGAIALWQIVKRAGVGNCVVTMLCALVMCGLAWLLSTHPDIARMTDGIFVSFEVTPRIIGTGSLVAAVLGIVASLAPSLAVARMSVVEGLKTLD